MRTINVTFKEEEYNKLLRVKGKTNWHDLIMQLTKLLQEKDILELIETNEEDLRQLTKEIQQKEKAIKQTEKEIEKYEWIKEENKEEKPKKEFTIK